MNLKTEIKNLVVEYTSMQRIPYMLYQSRKKVLKGYYNIPLVFSYCKIIA